MVLKHTVHIYQVCQIKGSVITGEYTLYQTGPDLLGVIWMHSWIEGAWNVFIYVLHHPLQYTLKTHYKIHVLLVYR